MTLRDLGDLGSENVASGGRLTLLSQTPLFLPSDCVMILAKLKVTSLAYRQELSRPEVR